METRSEVYSRILKILEDADVRLLREFERYLIVWSAFRRQSGQGKT
jgi:hypothetical protein